MDISDEIPVGAHLTLELVATEGDSCRGCFFEDLDSDIDIDCCQRIKCGATQRKDRKNVIFKLVENGK